MILHVFTRNNQTRAMKTVLISCAIPFLLLFAGCKGFSPGPRFNPYQNGTNAAPAFTNHVDKALLQAPTNIFTLGPGDKLEMEIIGDLPSRTLSTVGPDGKIYFNLLPGIDVWGMTLTQAKEALEKELGQYYKEKLQISMVLRGIESKRVWLLGRLNAPGLYPMATPVTLLEAISHAGGTLVQAGNRELATFSNVDEQADLDRSFVIRSGKYLPVNFRRLLHDGDLSQNIYLQPDDFVYLPGSTAQDVYVMGAVIQPRTVPYAREMTLLSAIAAAGGAAKDSVISEVALVRGSLANPQVAIVNYADIRKGRAPDVALQPRDIIYVPFSPFRIISRYAEMILDTFVNAVAINEGQRAVLATPQAPTGILIPLGSRITVNPAPASRPQ